MSFLIFCAVLGGVLLALRALCACVSGRHAAYRYFLPWIALLAFLAIAVVSYHAAYESSVSHQSFAGVPL